MSFDENPREQEEGFSSHELKTFRSSSYHPTSPAHRSKSTVFYFMLIVIIGLVIAFSGYVINNNLAKNPYKDQQIIQDDTKKTLPTLGDILWGTGGRDKDNQTGDLTVTSGDVLTYTGSTGDMDILSGLDKNYLQHIKDFIGLLGSDPNLRGYFDSDNILLTGRESIIVQPVSDLPATSIKLYGTNNPSLKNLYIVGVDEVVYYFDTIQQNNGIRSLELDGIDGSLKPGQNTYYIVGTDGTKYYINYIDYKSYDTEEFYQKLGRVCVLDVCTDPAIKLSYDPSDGSYLQQHDDTVIKVIPDQEITVATRCDGSSSSIISIKKIGEVYKKTTRGCGYTTNGDITQSFVNIMGETVTNHDLMKAYPSSIKRGNLTYIADFVINKNIQNFQKVDHLDYYDISAVSTSKGYLVHQVSFELPGNVFINYKLSNTTISALGYTQLLPGSNIGSAYKIAPRSFDWTTRSIIYTIPGADPDMASILNQKLLLSNPGRVVISPNCGQPSSSTDPNARFGIYPIDDNYDLIGFLNCNMIIRE